MKKSLLLLASVVAATANASITLSVDFGAMYTQTQGTDIAVGASGGVVGVLVASLKGNAFPQGAALSGLSLAQYSNWGNGNYVIAAMSATSTAIAGDPQGNASRYVGSLLNLEFGTAVYGADASFMGAGDQIALYWFPAITDTNVATGILNVTPSRVIQAGDKYGFFRTDVDTLGNTVAPTNTGFVLPADGQTVNIKARSVDALTAANETSVLNDTGSAPLTAATFVASLTVPVVPEPSTYAAIFGVVAIVVAYRRKK